MRTENLRIERVIRKVLANPNILRSGADHWQQLPCCTGGQPTEP